MTKPLFQPFDDRRQRGRPKTSAGAIATITNKKLGWLEKYPQKLMELNSDPLAWFFQIEARCWWIWAWEMALDEWLTIPSRFPRFARISDTATDVSSERFLQRFGNKKFEREYSSLDYSDLEFEYLSLLGLGYEDVDHGPQLVFDPGAHVTDREMKRVWGSSRAEHDMGEWDYRPASHEQIARLDLPYEAASLSGDDEQQLPSETMEDPDNSFARFNRMIQKDPLLTIRSLHKAKFSVRRMSDLWEFYANAMDRYDELLPAVVPLDEQHGHLADSRYEWIQVLRHLSPKQKVAAFKEFTNENSSTGWKLDFNALALSGVLQWIDLRIYELVRGIEVTADVKAEIIRMARNDLTRLGLKSKRVRASNEFPDLSTTRANVQALISRDSAMWHALRAEAYSKLQERWRMKKGRGDGRFLMRVLENPWEPWVNF